MLYKDDSTWFREYLLVKLLSSPSLRRLRVWHSPKHHEHRSSHTRKSPTSAELTSYSQSTNQTHVAWHLGLHKEFKMRCCTSAGMLRKDFFKELESEGLAV